MFEPKKSTLIASILGILCTFILSFFITMPKTAQKIVSPLAASMYGLQPLKERPVKNQKEVLGFVPFWQLKNVDNIDFNVLTTLAYFDFKITADGEIVKDDPGYQMVTSDAAIRLFKKAHANGTRVILTFTQMDTATIESFLDNPEAQTNAITESVNLVDKYGFDGANLDWEYFGGNGSQYMDKYTTFVRNFTNAMHARIEGSRVSHSIYASATLTPRMYDIPQLGTITDATFLMAYDYHTLGESYAAPNAPLYGYKSNRNGVKGEYWYDVSTAVEDFTQKMPANKLILGTALYGRNYLVYEPKIKGETRPSWTWRGEPSTVTFKEAEEDITPKMQGITEFKSGWDPKGLTAWKAYYDSINGTWRMLFYDDVKSLHYKFSFAKNRNLAGVGMWALGYEGGRTNFWNLLRDEFGQKLADNNVLKKIGKNI